MRHPLVRFAVRRLLVGIVLCFGITLITFTLTNLVPGDPVAANLSDEAMSDPEIVEAYRESHGLDEPPTTQYLRYLERLAHGDLGTSMQSGRSVSTDLREMFPATLELTIVAMVGAVVVGVGFGLIGALTRDRLPDQVIRVVSLAGSSTPIFSFASLLAGTVLIEQIFSWPGLGKYADGSAVNLDLPAIMGVTLLVAVIFILTNLVVDILAGIVDPRIRVR